jgi:capsular exopolysaccharide synthesis family protein
MATMSSFSARGTNVPATIGPAERLGVAEPLVSFLAPSSLEADQYRTVRHTMERLRRDAGFQVFAVTSPASGDGKSITALNVAGALAQSRAARVLLVDADLRRPSVGDYLGLEDQTPGLADALMNEDYGLSQIVRRIDSLNLSVLPAGRPQTQSYELLSSPRVEALLREARREYDYVLVDTLPLVPFPDSRLLGRWVDGFIIVVAAHRTPRKLVNDALNLLDPMKVKVIGTVFNGDDRPLRAHSGYYGYYSYHYDSSRSGAHDHWWHRMTRPRRASGHEPR